jgi:peptidoglycan/LPS O-acetylase OafA/YrhL
MEPLGVNAAYRPELDGIRAVAILSVLGFHVGFSDWTGGFLGVDVFFVLSGWLICGHIYDNLHKGKFDLLSFFARRIRRLIPAAFACYLVVTLVVFALFLPHEQQAYLRYLLGSTFFVNNVILAQEAGYFAPVAATNPLLHTWSLSIEEQFYLVVPWLALLMGKNARAFGVVLAVAFVVSFVLTMFSGQSIHSDEARYYSALFRIWEIAAGGLAFVLVRGRSLPTLPGLPLIALLAVLTPVFAFDQTLLHPGPGVAIVVLGTIGLILFARPEHSIVGRFLGSRAMSFIGRISYSTYLWHWPLIVFLNYVGYDLSDVTRVLVILGSLALGYLSFRVIEAPVRRINVPTRNRALLGGFVVQSAVILGVAGLLWIQSVGKDTGAGAQIATILEEGRIGNDRWGTCWYDTEAPEACTLGEVGSTGRQVVLWGDSMANSAVPAFDGFASRRGAAGLAFVAPSCAPLLGIANEQGDERACMALNDAVLDWLADQPASDIFLFARWPMYFLGYGHTDITTPGTVGFVDRDLNPLEQDAPDLTEAGLRGLMAAVPEQHRVFLVSPVPEYQEGVPDAMVRAIRFGDALEAVPRSLFDSRVAATIAQLTTIADEVGGEFIDLTDAFCSAEVCPYARDGVPILADQVHLTRRGNDILLGVLEDRVR